ncbi:MAG: hypothetical protein ACYCSJ_01500 [Acidimicrobiales bacterium]
MGLAIDTILGHATNPGTTFTAITRATGTPSQVRSFPQANWAQIEQIIRKGATKGAVRVLSPLLVTNIRGITYTTGETPATWLLPPTVGQKVQSGDTLTVELTGGTAETDVVAYSIYYQTLPSANARLFNPGTVMGAIANIKPIQVTVTTSGTVGSWSTTLVTATENLLKAGKTYAVLGYVTTTALAFVGLKSSTTNNFRVGGPGSTSTIDTTYWFLELSRAHGTPHIPVFNADNRTSVYVTAANDAASTAATITLICAELATNLAGAPG